MKIFERLYIVILGDSWIYFLYYFISNVPVYHNEAIIIENTILWKFSWILIDKKINMESNFASKQWQGVCL